MKIVSFKWDASIWRSKNRAQSALHAHFIDFVGLGHVQGHQSALPSPAHASSLRVLQISPLRQN